MSYGPPVAALVLTVTVFSFAGAAAFDGVPDSETGLFYLMAAVAGVERHGIHLASAGWRLVARVAAVGALASLAGVLLVRKHGARGARSA